MSEKKKKQRMTIRVHPEIHEKVKELYKQSGCTTMSQFYEKAIRFYCDYLTAENPDEYLPKAFFQSMDEIIEERDDHFEKSIFPIKVETAMLQNLIANLNRFDPIEIARMRGKCVDEVKSIKGMLRMEER